MSRSAAIALFCTWVLVLAAMPFVASNYFVKIATFLAMYGALALSWNFIGGYTGYPSFSTAAFVGLGAYAGAIAQNAGAPLLLAWLAGAPATATFAADPWASSGSATPSAFSSVRRSASAASSATIETFGLNSAIWAARSLVLRPATRAYTP